MASLSRRARGAEHDIPDRTGAAPLPGPVVRRRRPPPRELASVFGDDLVGVGVVDDVAAPGGWTSAPSPRRARVGRARRRRRRCAAFLNVCRHRGLTDRATACGDRPGAAVPVPRVGLPPRRIAGACRRSGHAADFDDADFGLQADRRSRRSAVLCSCNRRPERRAARRRPARSRHRSVRASTSSSSRTATATSARSTGRCCSRTTRRTTTRRSCTRSSPWRATSTRSRPKARSCSRGTARWRRATHPRTRCTTRAPATRAGSASPITPHRSRSTTVAT